MPDNVLGREVVELATKGLQKTEREIDGVRRRLIAADKQAVQMRRNFENVGRVAQRAFFIAGLGVAGFIRAGLQGTKEGERLNMAFKGLSTQVASLFLPSIDKLSSRLESLNSKMASLSGSQQDFTRQLLEGAAAAGITFAALNKLGSAKAGGVGAFLVSGFTSAGIGERQLGIVEKLQTTLERINKLRGDQAGGLESFLTGQVPKALQGIRELLGTATPPVRSDVTPTAPALAAAPGTQARGFEDIPDTFKRLQLGALKGDQESDTKRQTKAIEEMRDILRQIAGKAPVTLVGGGLAAVGP